MALKQSECGFGMVRTRHWNDLEMCAGTSCKRISFSTALPPSPGKQAEPFESSPPSASCFLIALQAEAAISTKSWKGDILDTTPPHTSVPFTADLPSDHPSHRPKLVKADLPAVLTRKPHAPPSKPGLTAATRIPIGRPAHENPPGNNFQKRTNMPQPTLRRASSRPTGRPTRGSNFADRTSRIELRGSNFAERSGADGMMRCFSSRSRGRTSRSPRAFASARRERIRPTERAFERALGDACCRLGGAEGSEVESAAALFATGKAPAVRPWRRLEAGDSASEERFLPRRGRGLGRGRGGREDARRRRARRFEVVLGIDLRMDRSFGA